MILHEEIHTLNSYFHNVTSILKYIKEDALIENEDTKEMLEMVIQREDKILEALNKLKLLNKQEQA